MMAEVGKMRRSGLAVLVIATIVVDVCCGAVLDARRCRQRCRVRQRRMEPVWPTCHRCAAPTGVDRGARCTDGGVIVSARASMSLKLSELTMPRATDTMTEARSVRPRPLACSLPDPSVMTALWALADRVTETGTTSAATEAGAGASRVRTDGDDRQGRSARAT